MFVWPPCGHICCITFLWAFLTPAEDKQTSFHIQRQGPELCPPDMRWQWQVPVMQESPAPTAAIERPRSMLRGALQLPSSPCSGRSAGQKTQISFGRSKSATKGTQKAEQGAESTLTGARMLNRAEAQAVPSAAAHTAAGRHRDVGPQLWLPSPLVFPGLRAAGGLPGQRSGEATSWWLVADVHVAGGQTQALSRLGRSAPGGPPAPPKALGLRSSLAVLGHFGSDPAVAVLTISWYGGSRASQRKIS